MNQVLRITHFSKDGVSRGSRVSTMYTSPSEWIKAAKFSMDIREVRERSCDVFEVFTKDSTFFLEMICI